MGVSIEVYRSRIGSHHNITHCRNRQHSFKGKLKSNTINVLLKCILFSICQKPIKEGKKQQRSVPVVCTNDILSCCLCAFIT